MTILTTQHYSDQYQPPAPLLDILVSALTDPPQPITALLDSGADGTVLPIDVLQAVGARYVETSYMRGVTGAPIVVDSDAVAIQVGGHLFPAVEAVAMPVDSEAVLGRDVLNQLNVILNGLANIVTIEA